MKKLRYTLKKGLKRLALLSLFLLIGAVIGYSYHHELHITFKIQGDAR